MRKRRSAKLPSKYLENMPLDHASRRSGTHLLSVVMLKNIGKQKRMTRKRMQGKRKEKKKEV